MPRPFFARPAPWQSALVGVLLTATSGHAEVPAKPLLQALQRARAVSPLRAVASPSAERVGVLLESSEALDGAATRVTGDVYFARRTLPELRQLFARHPRASAFWAPPLRPMLDRVDGWVGASTVRNRTGLSGAGVFVGVVDTGFDVRHGDLRDADGGTRVAWMIDFSRVPSGRHPDLEDQYGCTSGDFVCRVFDREDIDELLDNSVTGDEPTDQRGHGTHVASLAAGNGLSETPATYVGMAPGADLALAQVAGPDGSIDEVNVLVGTRFIFDRAREEHRPAVVNISLGTDFGPHDGSSLVERALATFVSGPEPGRALVVAAGNSASQTVGLTHAYPEPLGVHTEVHVPAHTTVRVPVLTLSADATTIGSVFVWLQFRPGDRLRVGFGDGSDSSVVWVEHGDSGAYAVKDGDADYQVTVVNSPAEPDATLGVGRHSAAVIISGSWPRGQSFVLSLEGQGSAQMWVEGAGALTPGLGGGAFLPRSSKESTITIPASNPDLIAVGATLNRKSWPTLDSDIFTPAPPPALDVPLDSVAYFSSAGPTADGGFKPELVAPGVNVVGAMSRDADPRDSAQSFFSSPSCEEPTCLVVDDRHAVSSGTSMAAPIVAGAAALLLERDPGLSASQLGHILMAGTRAPGGEVRVEQQMGAGALDVAGSLAVLDRMALGTRGTGTPSKGESRLVLGSSFVHPDPAWPLHALLLLRDAQGTPLDPASTRVRVDAVGAESTSADRLAPGMWSLRVAAPADAGGESLTVRAFVDDELLLQRTLPVAVDRSVAHDGFVAQGGCSLIPEQAPGCAWLLLFSLGFVLPWRRARAHSRTR